jgi:hypothetical protein
VLINSIHEALTHFQHWALKEGFAATTFRELRSPNGLYAAGIILQKDREVKRYFVTFTREWFGSFERTCHAPGQGIGYSFDKIELSEAVSRGADLAVVYADGKIYSITTKEVLAFVEAFPGAVYNPEYKGIRRPNIGVPVKMLNRLNPEKPL